MEKLIGLDEITNILQNYCNQFEVTIKPYSDFSYFYIDDIITYSLVEMNDMGDVFLNNVRKRFPHINAPLFIWSLFHEIGHSQTIEELTDDEVEQSKYIKHIAGSNFEIYASAPDERAATDWAGWYLELHPQEVRDLWNKLVPAIKYFYKVNDIQE